MFDTWEIFIHLKDAKSSFMISSIKNIFYLLIKHFQIHRNISPFLWTAFTKNLTRDEECERITRYVLQAWLPFIHVNIVGGFVCLFGFFLAFLDIYSSWHPACNSLQNCFVPAPHPVLHSCVYSSIKNEDTQSDWALIQLIKHLPTSIEGCGHTSVE